MVISRLQNQSSNQWQNFDRLPTAEELPYSDGKPVDSELQDLIPHLLQSILDIIWTHRYDWFFGIDMGWYYHPKKPAVVPDGFLSLGVPRIVDPEKLRLSYLSWAENTIPCLTVEVVSKTAGGEYKQKKDLYASLGVLYYVIYDPRRRRKPRLTIYRLTDHGQYELCNENPYWMPEIGLAIGTGIGSYRGINREWLYWYDQQGTRYLSHEEIINQANIDRQETELALQKSEEKARKLAEKLRSLGINPDD
jgi:Uma2 family endonuclease